MNGRITAKYKTINGRLWLVCPVCGRKKILKLPPDTSASRLILYCPACKRNFRADIRAGDGTDRVKMEICE